MPDETAIAPAQESEKTLAVPETPESRTIAARHVGDVLPTKFYEGASTLSLTPEEIKKIAEYRTVPEGELDIRPDDGAIYAGHNWYESALTDIFGPGQWAVVPGSPIQTDDPQDPEWIFQRWILLVRGCYIAETIGQARYNPTNMRTNKALAAESARSDAIPRLCAKGSLAIGNNTWIRRFANNWRAKNCVKVEVLQWNPKQQRKERKSAWRRKDDVPLSDEIQSEEKPVASNASMGVEMEPPTKTPTTRLGSAPASTPGPVQVEKTLFTVQQLDGETYLITGDKRLIDANNDILGPLWNAERQEIIANGEELNTVSYGLEERGIKLRALKPAAKQRASQGKLLP